MLEFLSLFEYGFVLRGLQAGIIVALIAPFIGIFLVLRRYSLIADTLSHVSLAGIALGFLLGIPPLIAALGTTILASLGIERLRQDTRIYGESALALFMSGSLALATVLLSLSQGFNAGLLNYLFGSIVTVTQTDVVVIACLAFGVACILGLFFKELVFTAFDEASAKVSGIPVRHITNILIVLSAITIAVAIPIVGVLLIAALIVIPVITALQLRRSFVATLIYAEVFSVTSVVLGILTSFYFNLSTGGTIVLIMLGLFLLVAAFRR